jgi:hypothetical protein
VKQIAGSFVILVRRSDRDCRLGSENRSPGLLDGGWVVKMKRTDWEILIIFTFCAAVALIVVWRLGW